MVIGRGRKAIGERLSHEIQAAGKARGRQRFLLTTEANFVMIGTMDLGSTLLFIEVDCV
jgi:hypothetical protein